MKKFIGSLVASSFVAGSAFAADMPVEVPLYKAPPPVVYSWTGFYVGGNVGWAHESVSNTYLAPGPGAPGYLPADQPVISAGSSNSFSV